MVVDDRSGLAATVERRARLGEALDHVEAYIEQQPLDDDTKAALWLLAWSVEPQRQLAHPTRTAHLELEPCHD